MRSVLAVVVMTLGVGSGSALAQTAPVPTAQPAVAAPAVPAKSAAAPAAAQKCMRLPLSDIAVGRPETIAQAQLRLKEYSEAEAKRRGWKGPLVKSNETVSCEDYLYLPVIGQEYKCLVTATFCNGPAAPAGKTPTAKPVVAAPKAAAKPASAAAPKPAPKPAN